MCTPRAGKEAETPRRGEPAGVSGDRLNAAATEVLLAEYQFLSGLIPFYRRVELTALGGTGVVLSGVVAALAALEAAEGSKASAEAVLLSVGSWAPVFLLLLENTALTRLRRASLYIAEDLYPVASRLTGRTDLLRWELAPGARLMGSVRWRRPVGIFASSIPLVVTIACTSLVFAIAGAAIDCTVLNVVVGATASACALGLAVYGIVFTWVQEHRAPADASPSRSADDGVTCAGDRGGNVAR